VCEQIAILDTMLNDSNINLSIKIDIKKNDIKCMFIIWYCILDKIVVTFSLNVSKNYYYRPRFLHLWKFKMPIL